MQGLSQKDKELLMKMNTEGLTSAQVRILRSLHSLMATVLTSEDESEYFESSAELVKKAAELIKHSNFCLHHTQMAYGEQAVEFAVDTLAETLEDGKSDFDN
jgi:hypothetical protein